MFLQVGTDLEEAYVLLDFFLFTKVLEAFPFVNYY